MKNISKFIIPIMIISLFTISCDNDGRVDSILKGNHELRKFNVKTTTEKESGGWFFIVVGGYSSKETSETKVRFYWKDSTGNYILTTMDLDQVMIKIDSVKTPYVTFEYKVNETNVSDRSEPDIANSVLGRYNSAATIHCRNSDFQPDININDLK
jgi:hypothetical protein